MAWTADNLLTNVRLRARIPDGSSVASDAELLLLADELVADTFLPLIRGAAEEYMVAQQDTTITSGTAAYRIPERAQVQGLRDVILVQASSGDGVSMPRVPLEERAAYTSGPAPGWRAGVGFCVQGDKVILLPSPTQSGFTLRMRYYQRPSRLVPAASAAKVTVISATPSFTVDAVPSTWTTSLKYDTIEGTPGFDWLGLDATATTASGTTMAFAATPSSEIAIGDYFALAGETPVPQIPAELHSTLVLALVARVHGMVGDAQAEDRALRQLAGRLEAAKTLLAPRVDGEEIRIINRTSPLRSGRWR